LPAHAGDLPPLVGAAAAPAAAAPHAILVNTAHGEIVDEEELIRLLETRAIAGAGLDVFEHEPAVDPRLTVLDNVVLLPPPYPRNARLGGRPSGGSPGCGGGNGRGSATIEGRIAMGERVIINIKTFADGHRPPDRVIGAML